MKTIPCLVCDKELTNWDWSDEHIQPLSGLHFKSYGHYGSAVFDPMDGSSLDIAVCDECLLKHKDKICGTGKTEHRFG